MHGIITLHDVDPIVGESHNSLSPIVDGAVQAEGGHPYGKPPSHVVQQDPVHPSFPGLRGLAMPSSILVRQANSMSSWHARIGVVLIHKHHG